VHRWVQRFIALLADAARFSRHRFGDRWHVDETCVKVGVRWVYLYRAVDQFGQVVDVNASARRDGEAARRFFQRAKATGVVPVEAITDRAPAYLRVWVPKTPVGCQNSATPPELGVHAAGWYSLIRPPSMVRRVTRWAGKPGTGWSGRGGRSWRLRCGRRPL
jgi:DDE domain